LMILSVAAVALTVQSSAAILLVRLARPRVVSAIAGVATVVNIGLNLLLIPTIGIEGAALGSLVSYWCLFGLTVALLRRQPDFDARSLFRPRRDDLVPRAFRRATRSIFAAERPPA
jgi:Na+-driven multidrug efflux pump